MKSYIGILLDTPFTANGGNMLRSSWRLIISKSMIHGITIEQSGTKPLFQLKADIYIIERMTYAPIDDRDIPSLNYPKIAKTSKRTL